MPKWNLNSVWSTFFLWNMLILRWFLVWLVCTLSQWMDVKDLLFGKQFWVPRVENVHKNRWDKHVCGMTRVFEVMRPSSILLNHFNRRFICWFIWKVDGLQLYHFLSIIILQGYKKNGCAKPPLSSFSFVNMRVCLCNISENRSSSFYIVFCI